MKIPGKLTVLILIVGIFSFGCAAVEKPILGKKHGAIYPSTGRPVVDNALLTQKIEDLSELIKEYRALERQLMKDGGRDEETLAGLRQIKGRAENLVKTYEDIERLQGKLSGMKPYAKDAKIYRKMIKALFGGLTRLEAGCFDHGEDAWLAEKGFLSRYALKIAQVEEFCGREQYPELVESYEKTKEIYGETLIPANIKLCYADALSFTGRMMEAIAVAEAVLEAEASDSIGIRSNLIDWHLRTEDPQGALKNFKELSRELDRKMDAFLLSRKRITLPTDGDPGEALKKPSMGVITEEDLRTYVDASEEGGALKEDEKEMIYSIFNLDDTLAREIMVPRIDVVAIESNTSVRQALDVIVKAGHSRVRKPYQRDDRGLSYYRTKPHRAAQN